MFVSSVDIGSSMSLVCALMFLASCGSRFTTRRFQVSNVSICLLVYSQHSELVHLVAGLCKLLINSKYLILVLPVESTKYYTPFGFYEVCYAMCPLVQHEDPRKTSPSRLFNLVYLSFISIADN